MNKRVAGALFATCAALVRTVLIVPLRTGWRYPPVAASKIAEFDASLPGFLNRLDAEDRAAVARQAEERRWGMLGRPFYVDPPWPPRFDWIWHRPPVDESVRQAHGTGSEAAWSHDISWSIVFAEQALILLLGGGLLTWVVRRERRKRAAV